MTAGSGIVHQEMPRHVDEPLNGFQLWVNLPAAQKMMIPRYNGILSSQIPAVELEPGIQAKVISGSLAGAQGPMKDLVVDIGYYDLTLAPGSRIGLPLPAGHRAFAYLYDGRGSFAAAGDQLAGAGQLIVFADDGEAVQIQAGEVAVNAEVELRRGRKLRAGDVVTARGRRVQLTRPSPPPSSG